MKHYYFQILLVVIGYAPLVAQNELATTANAGMNLLEGPCTPLKSLMVTETRFSASTIDTATKMEILANESLQGAPLVHIIDEAPGQDSLSLFSDGTTHLDPNEPVIIDALFVYPNPSNGIVQVKLPGKVSIQVYTLAGELVSRHQLPPGERMLDLTTLAAGIYQIRAKSDEDYFSGKLLIQ